MMNRFLSSACVVMLLASASASAKNINLYTEPKADSKVVGTVNSEHGVTIVFTPKTGDWIKVANPENGEVGWVKSSELGGNGYNMRITTAGDGAHKYSVYQFGTGGAKYSQQQLEREMRLFEQQQRMMQWHMAHMFNDMFYFPQPIFVPVMVVPEKPKPQKASPVKVPPTSSTVQSGQDKH